VTEGNTADSVLIRRAALRLGLQAAALVSAIVVLLSAAAVAVVINSQHAAATTLLDAAVSRADDVDDPPAGMWLARQGPDGIAVTAGMPAGLPDTSAIEHVATGGPQETQDFRVAGAEYRLDTVRQPDGTVVQGVLDLTANHAERNLMLAVLLGAGGIGLVLAAVAGAWLGHHALRPLSAALALQRRFVADAGHELRTPVTLLNTRAQLLRRRMRAGRDTGSALGDLDGIVADSARLGEILEDLLIASDPIAERPHEPVDVTAIARAVLTAAGPEAADQGMQLTGPEPDAPARYVDGSPVALRRAVTALVDNAVRHAGHTVTVSVDARHGEVLLDVSDDGPGIDPELSPRLFERFVSGRTVPGERRRRYGLGLALVSEIAVGHHGRVELLDQEGPGAALRLRLPAAPSAGGPRLGVSVGKAVRRTS
jgi:two-component system, OmpR family, sensor kinase